MFFKRFKYKTKPEMKVNFFLKSLWSLVLAMKIFFWLEYVSFWFRTLQVMKNISFDQFNSHILVLHWLDMDFVAVHIVTISCGISNEHCIVYVYIVFCKNLSKKWDCNKAQRFVISTLWKIKIKAFPSSGSFPLGYEIT